VGAAATADDDSDAAAEDGNDSNASMDNGEVGAAPTAPLPTRCAVLPG
jgi:hypothetical protein